MPHYSLNEIEVTARKAARGAGYDWGLADEAGKATRWLSARGLAGAGPLVALLEQSDGRPYRDLKPRIEGDTWRPPRDHLCPLVVGAALSDRFDALMTGAFIRLNAIISPIFLMPFLGSASEASGLAVAVSWQGMEVRLAPGALSINGREDVLETAGPVDAVVSRTPLAETLPASSPRFDGVSVDAAIWRRLDALAARTYVPDSEASRLTGAGAGMIDND